LFSIYFFFCFFRVFLVVHFLTRVLLEVFYGNYQKKFIGFVYP